MRVTMENYGKLVLRHPEIIEEGTVRKERPRAAVQDKKGAQA